MPHLITGGARSGKSRHAEELAGRHSGPVCYLATAEVRDAEFARRVERHRAQRPPHWDVAEAGRGLAAAIAARDAADGLLLIDCLGMWLMRFFGEAGFDEAGYAAERDALLAALERAVGEVLLVSNEVGWGVVAADVETRRFVDELGRLNQLIAARCGRVTLVACGLPLALKGMA
ncbi:bifunctional adenosylcobinamide kinase/adenosylcobinamide-phosphate guanylyltransferase [Chromobacterium sp. ATCC 53434]|uniref:bifunctional adenosylcobinamide kinase/adenosylcobinamide-phosphate guanylyltransferase n=1 Tax=Chromobacterium sp. (strain ATCC 53434 / SC 14030) TaxID=2059672 RepID=UPI000C756C44|nr:bifunctional adenosylcobinamide kinase/adenosylcobinamide-phosphate guanylyltransferase [Chromobacterium sp. ATCC 53434]AUH53309.1 bifunctional adenosylcobinamide kinase/adenosylcobinamide-phosphate guanylyltransferase [Chromobacterium sp. ATCC 53434]